MAVLPEGGVISGVIEVQDEPSLTWLADRRTGRITGTGDGLAAVKQTIEIILSVERFYWQIYTPYFGMQWDNLIGLDPGYVASELQRRLRDAFSIDRRILGLEDFAYTVEDDAMTASFTVPTVYGDVQQEVTIG